MSTAQRSLWFMAFLGDASTVSAALQRRLLAARQGKDELDAMFVVLDGPL
jgi:hypothetical protein